MRDNQETSSHDEEGVDGEITNVRRSGCCGRQHIEQATAVSMRTEVWLTSRIESQVIAGYFIRTTCVAS
jgi:hypothetical protein